MKRKALIVPLILAGMALFAGRLSAQCLSATCPSQTLGTVDFPLDGQTVSGFVRVIGFALDGNLVSNVDVFVDGTDESNRVTSPGGANINLPRPDVMQMFPAYLGTAGQFPGWETSFRAISYSNGVHTVYVRITDVNGCCYFLTPRTVKIDNTRNQPPFGDVYFPLADGSVNANGVLEVSGWALDDHRVDHVDIMVDGLLERQAVMGVYSPAVYAAYPDTLSSITAGFILNLDSTRYTNGVHTVTVKAVDDQGQQGLLGTRRIQVFNNSPNLPPFGEIEFPLLNATLWGNCFTAQGGPSGGDIIEARFVQNVIGWALDTSVVQERGGVSHVQLELDGVLIKDTRINCHRESMLAGAMVDCFGFYRPDIEILYPGFQQVPNVGYNFSLDIGFLLTQRKFVEGAHILQLKAADKEDQITLIKELPVVLECSTFTLDPPPLAYVDDPTNYKFINGIYPVLGWALDFDVVVHVRVLIDGIVQIDAVSGNDFAEYGFASPDVYKSYPSYPQSSAARWRFFLDTTRISNSEHDLLVEVEDSRGNRRSAGTRRFVVDNNTLVR
jgi:hypothetical protein